MGEDWFVIDALPDSVWGQIPGGPAAHNTAFDEVWQYMGVRHEAHVTVWAERAHSRPVAAGRGSWGQPDPGDAGKGGSSPDNVGRDQHRQRPRSRKQDGMVHECRNQWWNPLKIAPGSNLADRGRYRSEGAPGPMRTCSLPSRQPAAGALGKDCGVPKAGCRGRAGHHPRRTVT